MFDLFRSRDKAVRILLSALLLMVALSMVTYLIPNYGSGDRAQDTVVAQIGKDTITLREAQLLIQTTLRGRQIPPTMVSLYVPQMIDQMITERTLAYEAKQLGLTASEQDISNAIHAAIPQLFQDGKFVGKDQYAAMLAQQNLTIADFENDMARAVIVNRLKQVAVEGTVIGPAEIEQEFRRRNEKAQIAYVNISPDKLKSEVKISPAELQEYYDKNRASYTIPEKRNLSILVLEQAKIEQAINPTDAELRRAYENQKDNFRTAERVKARHILLKTTGKTPEEEAQVKTKAEGLLKQIKGGADFADLARKNSEDTSSAVKGGNLDWIVRGQTVKEFGDTAFSLKPKELSGLVKTEYGYHIIQVMDHQQAHQQTFDEVKPQLSTEYRRQRASAMMQELIDRAQSALKKDSPQKVAAALNLEPPEEANNVAPGNPLPAIGVNRDFEQSLTGLQKGDVSQPVAVPPNRVAMAVVTAVIPAHPATLDEVQARVRQALEGQKGEQLVAQRASDLAAKAKAMDGDLQKAAKSMGLEVKTPPPFDRQGAVEGLGQASSVGLAFTLPVGDIMGPVPIPGGGRVVAKILPRVAADMSQLAAQRSGLRDELKGRKGRERDQLFEEGLRDRLIKEGKVKIHQDVVNRLVANFRG